ncbi:MAG: toxin [Sulfurimonas sp.]|nr:toxin [Sulfurimonas sp.]
MTTYNWNKEKNLLLKESRDISFEQIVMHIEQGDLLDVIKHPNSERYDNQKILVINVNDYVYLVPFVENDNEKFLKTIIPNRQFTKKYLGGKK